MEVFPEEENVLDHAKTFYLWLCFLFWSHSGLLTQWHFWASEAGASGKFSLVSLSLFVCSPLSSAVLASIHPFFSHQVWIFCSLPPLLLRFNLLFPLWVFCPVCASDWFIIWCPFPPVCTVSPYDIPGRDCWSTSKMKYILVTGGVISGIGKGIIASSVGTILKSCVYCYELSP